MESLTVVLTPFVLNAAMAGVKLFADSNLTTLSKRSILALFALIGAIAQGYITGQPVDVDSISSLAGVVTSTFVQFLLAHSTYVLFWKK